jgi:hypothetical protein
MTWLSSVLPPFALSAFAEDWMAARVSQHRVRTRFPGAVSAHAPQHSQPGSRRAVTQGVPAFSTLGRAERGQP